MRPQNDPTSGGLIWDEGGAQPLDRGGPTDRPYDAALARQFVETGGFSVIETVAKRYPDKIAVDDGRRTLTYAAFLRRVYALAAQIERNTQPGDVLVSLCGHTATSTVMIMATAMSGRILVPIDAGHPEERQRAIFEQSGAAALLVDAAEAPGALALSWNLPILKADLDADDAVAPPPYRHDPDAPLFVSFTSGSTGRPKGVVGGGRYGEVALKQFIDMFHINAHDVIIGLASLSVGGARDAFAALGTGAKIVLVDVRTQGMSHLLDVLAREQVTILSFVPSALRMILSIEGVAPAFRSLRVLDLHGERILAEDMALFRRTLPATCRISITMGSVEAGAVFSWFVDDSKIEGDTVPVGYLLPTRKAALLPDEESPPSDGEVGLLVVRGPMALGAWQDGRLAQGPFLPDPDAPSSKTYALGDVMRRRPDGLYEYIARRDRRIKIQGLWADLSEIEVAAQNIAEVEEAVAVIVDRAGQADQIALFVKTKAGHPPPAPGDVRLAIARSTAEHMVPADIRFIETIPRLPNYKVDLVALRKAVG